MNKNNYTRDVILPALETAFARGSKKYTGIQHFDSATHTEGKFEDDIRHIRSCHVDVRLLEAEDLASVLLNEKSQDKIISAIGYLVILHMRQTARLSQ